MDGIPIHVLKALASLQNQISHVHAKRTDACDLFIGFAYFEFARFLGQFRINSKRLLYFTHKSHTGPPLRYVPVFKGQRYKLFLIPPSVLHIFTIWRRHNSAKSLEIVSK